VINSVDDFSDKLASRNLRSTVQRCRICDTHCSVVV